MEEKIEFISNNKDSIIENMTAVSYDLYSILSSNRSLKDLEEYKKLLSFFEKREAIINYDTKDEIYVLSSLSNFINKIPMKVEERERFNNIISTYTNLVIRMQICGKCKINVK